MYNARYMYQDKNDFFLVLPEDGFEKICRNVVSFQQFYAAP